MLADYSCEQTLMQLRMKCCIMHVNSSCWTFPRLCVQKPLAFPVEAQGFTHKSVLLELRQWPMGQVIQLSWTSWATSFTNPDKNRNRVEVTQFWYVHLKTRQRTWPICFPTKYLASQGFVGFFFPDPLPPASFSAAAVQISGLWGMTTLGFSLGLLAGPKNSPSP